MARVSPARKLAFDILVQVDDGQLFASDLLQSGHVSALSERDRGLATEIVMGVLRWQGEIDFRLQQLSGKSSESLDREVATALRMGIYQIAFLEKIPKSAAVNESVELTKQSGKRSAAGLVNAVLRKCEPEKLLQDIESAQPDDTKILASVRRSVPAWLLERWEVNFGAKAANRLALASVKIPTTTLRICSSTPEPARVVDKLEEQGSKIRPGQYASQALIAESGEGSISRLAEKMDLAIQDEASQLVAELVAVRPGNRVLDLCAAPGMKTSMMVDHIGRGFLVACDASARRLRTMRKLLPRLTSNATAVLAARLDATEDLPFRREFDRILVDAPCSGTGTLARNPEIKWRLTKEDVRRLSAVQSKILSNALSLLAPGGRLVYSTCSMEPEENEKVVESVLSATQGYRLLNQGELLERLPKLAPLIDERGYFRTRPDLHSMDGFFAAAITRELAVTDPESLIAYPQRI